MEEPLAAIAQPRRTKNVCHVAPSEVACLGRGLVLILQLPSFPVTRALSGSTVPLREVKIWTLVS